MFWNKKEPAIVAPQLAKRIRYDSSKDSFISRSVSNLLDVLEARLDHHFGLTQNFVQPDIKIVDDGSPFAKYVLGHNLTIEEYLVLTLAMAPHLQADAFSLVIRRYLPQGGDFAEFGGTKGMNYRGILPTGETALFLLAGMNTDVRLQYMNWLKGISTGRVSMNGDKQRKTVFQEGVVTLEQMKEGEPEMSGRLIIPQEKIIEFMTGEKWRPVFGSDFPASLLETKMTWDDIVLSPQTQRELSKIQNWLVHHDKIDSDRNLGKRTKPGYRVLFYGPPGTGKTLTASLLGKQHGLDVYRIDLSLVVSKYIGETEKNLKTIFDMAHDWILFFDEADALFGKRTNVQSAHDRFANQEVSYLLQKIEEHPGLVVLATNFRNNMDQAFVRRFQTVVPFNLPNEEESLLLWQSTMPADIPWSQSISLADLARKYELTGASILNIVQSASILALSANREITFEDIFGCIQNEYYKNGKSI